MSSQVKVCRKCGESKPLTEYHKQGAPRTGLRARCKVCCYEDTRRHRARNPRAHTITRYGITVDEYEEMARLQGHVCKVCKSPPGRGEDKHLCIDHDHETGRVRGLLCHRCNAALGYARDSPVILRALATYLEDCANGACPVR